MSKIVYSQSEFQKHMELLQAMETKAALKVPTIQDLKDIIFKNPFHFFTLLMWINKTGEKTKDNSQSYSEIRKYLNSSIEIIPDDKFNDKTVNCNKNTLTEKIHFTYDEYDRFMDQIEKLHFKADTFVPSMNDLRHIILPNVSYFIALLIWIEETGYETKDNKQCRKLIHQTLTKCIVLTDNNKENNTFRETKLKELKENSTESSLKLPDTKKANTKEETLFRPVIHKKNSEPALKIPSSLLKIKIRCSYDDYDKYVELFHKMNYKANDYVPEYKDFINVILPKLPEYIIMLMWIDETGENTEENIEIRKMIRQILTSNLELV